jgi:hypothetical protein
MLEGACEQAPNKNNIARGSKVQDNAVLLTLYNSLSVEHFALQHIELR